MFISLNYILYKNQIYRVLCNTCDFFGRHKYGCYVNKIFNTATTAQRIKLVFNSDGIPTGYDRD